jgi:hypothetical protein
MARYKYHNDWEASAQSDSNFWVKCETLSEALSVAETKRDRNPQITVHAEFEHSGFPTTAHVGLNLHEMDGKSLREIMDLLDKEVDQFIAFRVKAGH